MEDIPLLEFDHDTTALIEPRHFYKQAILPECCVMPFYGSLIENLKGAGKLEKVFELSTSAASLISIEVFKIAFKNKYVTIVFPGLGAPFAGAVLEELIALGCRKIVACGSGGALDAELRRGSIVIPSSAVRDEGTSYHYLPPSRIVAMDPEIVPKLEAILRKHHISYRTGKTWTTDAFYRETKGKISRRKEEGCLMVEMECSALLAVAKFRGVLFGQYLGAGDDVSGDEWDPRFVNNKMPFQEKIFWLSVEACLSL
jgi:uridine phosphorylase